MGHNNSWVKKLPISTCQVICYPMKKGTMWVPYARKRSSYTGWTETMIIVWGEEEGVPPLD